MWLGILLHSHSIPRTRGDYLFMHTRWRHRSDYLDISGLSFGMPRGLRSVSAAPLTLATMCTCSVGSLAVLGKAYRIIRNEGEKLLSTPHLRGRICNPSVCGEENAAWLGWLVRPFRPAQRFHSAELPIWGSGPHPPQIIWSCSTSWRGIYTYVAIAEVSEVFSLSPTYNYNFHVRWESISAPKMTALLRACGTAVWHPLSIFRIRPTPFLSNSKGPIALNDKI